MRQRSGMSRCPTCLQHRHGYDVAKKCPLFLVFLGQTQIGHDPTTITCRTDTTHNHGHEHYYFFKILKSNKKLVIENAIDKTNHWPSRVSLLLHVLVFPFARHRLKSNKPLFISDVVARYNLTNAVA